MKNPYDLNKVGGVKKLTKREYLKTLCQCERNKFRNRTGNTYDLNEVGGFNVK